jgi:hypothetical protein
LTTLLKLAEGVRLTAVLKLIGVPVVKPVTTQRERAMRIDVCIFVRCCSTDYGLRSGSDRGCTSLRRRI